MGLIVTVLGTAGIVVAIAAPSGVLVRTLVSCSWMRVVVAASCQFAGAIFIARCDHGEDFFVISLLSFAYRLLCKAWLRPEHQHKQSC